MIDRMMAWLFLKLSHRLGAIDEPWYGWINALANRLLLFRHPEKVKHLGPLNPDKTLYVINDFQTCTGLASWYDKALGYVKRAKAKGWVPVIATSAAKDYPFGDWYTYFDRVSTIDPKDIASSRHVVFATPHATIYKRYNKAEISRRHEIASQVSMNDTTHRFVVERFSALLGGSAKGLIGAYYRGTDYRVVGNWHPVGHSVVPDVRFFCDRLIDDARKWNVPLDDGAHFFIVTEEQEAVDAIRERFPKCHFVTKERFSNFKGERNICLSRLPATSPVDNNRLYLLDLYILSECDYLVGTVNSGMQMALNWNGNAYKDVDLIKMGVN